MTGSTRSRLQVLTLVFVLLSATVGLSISGFAFSDAVSVHVGDGTPVSGETNDVVTVSVWTDARNVAGYQANLTFDPSVVQVTAVGGSGDFAAPVVTIDNETGWVDFNQLRSGGVDGPVLAELTLELVGPSGGETTLTFVESDTVLSSGSGESVSPSAFDGITVSIGGDSTPTPTPEPTPTPTPEPTPTPTPEPTPTPTPEPTPTPTPEPTPTPTPEPTPTPTPEPTPTPTPEPTPTPTPEPTPEPTPTPTPEPTPEAGSSGGNNGNGGGGSRSGGGGGGSSSGGGSKTAEPTAPAFVVGDVNVTTAALEPGDTATVLVVVENEGDAKGTYEGALSVDGELLETLTATVAAGETAEFEVNYTVGSAGTYNLTLGEAGVVGQLVVNEPPTPEPTPSPTPEPTASPTAVPTTQADPTPSTSTDTGPTAGTDDVPQAGGISGGAAPGFGITAVVVALLLISVVALRRSK